jgi:hypothetical protein
MRTLPIFEALILYSGHLTTKEEESAIAGQTIGGFEPNRTRLAQPQLFEQVDHVAIRMLSTHRNQSVIRFQIVKSWATQTFIVPLESASST